MSRARTVVVLTRHTGGFFAGELLAGLVRTVQAEGGRCVVVQAVEPDDAPDRLSPAEIDLPVAMAHADAVVSVAPAATRPLLERLQRHGVPVVLASDRMAGIEAPVVTPDNRGGVRAAYEHLRAHGHERIGFLGSLDLHDFRERHATWAELLRADGGDPVALHLPSRGWSESHGEEAAALLEDVWQPPTAVIAANDQNALGFVRGLRRAGLRVPQDVAVIGFDDIEASRVGAPSISTVHQRFDAVGTLAARLALRLADGEDVPATEHRASLTTVLPRGSCGCRGDLIDVDARPRVRSSGLGPSREELSEVLHTMLDDRAHGALHAGLVERVVDRVDGLLRRTDAVPDEDVVALVRWLQRVTDEPDTAHRLVVAVTEYLQRVLATRGVGRTDLAIATRLAAAVWELRAWVELGQGRRREDAVVEHGQVRAELLRLPGPQVRGLAWLAGTHVRSAVLALWRPGSRTSLRVVGVHGDAARRHEAGEEIEVGEFPPTDLLADVRPQDGEVCFVSPVRSTEHDWGLLALVGEVDVHTTRETYRDWGATLCAALEQEALQEAVRTSEQRYAHAARAANDGLWEVESTDRSVYMSPRCRELLGLAPEGRLDTAAWNARIHPADLPDVRRAMSRAARSADEPVEVEYRVGDEDAGWRWVLSRGLGMPDGEGRVVRVVGSLSDVHHRKVLEQQLRQAAMYDAVTGLPNRRLFLERLGGALDRAHRRPDAGFAVVFLDLDGFKLVNDSLGHLRGDELLREVGHRLRTVLRTTDTAARFGGDEFAVLLADPVPEELLVIAERIQHEVARPVRLGDDEVSVTASVGIATSTTGYDDPEDVLRDADIAMYHAKESERGTASVFDQMMHTRAAGRLRTRSEVRAALEERQFVVHYQPIVALDGSREPHFEALVRWEHPERGLLQPHAFLLGMEGDATIVALGEWVRDEVCRQVAAWYAETGRWVRVSVNLAHREFWSERLVGSVTTALARHAVPASSLVLEITESVVMTETSAALEIMGRLKAEGLRLHIDDFGTGHSSLAALRGFPVDALKIDGAFVAELGVVEQTTELVRVIVGMGRALDLEVVAEHVETPEQHAHLRRLGCTHAQGWLYGRAVPAGDATPLVADGGPEVPDVVPSAPLGVG
ncbi:EAL domain-containing protein [Cellulomonas sp. APG4]|uniref:EAL domain-containing protein n=1 Tax=Cellulomonas sp. APG4 TaxID=1538656 RepID=UPI00137A18EB|nr:EAL domain-containing protein [Cellulomonas sp. APG4]